MYTIKESWQTMFGQMPMENWDGEIYCVETNAAKTLRTNETQGFLSAYTFTLITEGWMTIIYNDRMLTLKANDIYLYSPGLTVSIASVSENYRAICLLVDEHTTLEMPTVRNLVNIAYRPIVQLHEPKISLNQTTALHLAERMREIIGYLHSEHIYKQEILRMLYEVFLLDLQNAQHQIIADGHKQVPQRTEEIFVSFIRMLPDYFYQHHNIAFYAEQLHITPVYLSRVVRRATGRTVVDYINQMLLMEASFLLRTSAMSIAQIADRLHFADTPSFSKFFSRLKGISPRQYRTRRKRSEMGDRKTKQGGEGGCEQSKKEKFSKIGRKQTKNC